MTPLLIFKNELVNSLRGSLRANLEKYAVDEIWVTEVSTKNNRDMQTGMELAEASNLELPGDGDLKDVQNAIRLHRALRRLTPLQATDPRLWTRLTHIEFWPYMRLRWPVEKYLPTRDKAVRYVESRYFVAQSQSRALLRNGIARLWWTAQLSYEPTRDDPYELTGILLSSLDITQQLAERGIGRSPTIIMAFLEFLRRNRDTLLTGGDNNRVRIRSLSKYLNMYGGVCVLDILSQGEIVDILEKEFARVLQREKQNANAP